MSRFGFISARRKSVSSRISLSCSLLLVVSLILFDVHSSASAAHSDVQINVMSSPGPIADPNPTSGTLTILAAVSFHRDNSSPIYSGPSKSLVQGLKDLHNYLKARREKKDTRPATKN